MNTDRATRVRLGAFEVDLGSGELYSLEAEGPQRRILLQEQPFRVLHMLIDRAGQVASREELRKQLWPNDTEVDFNHSINVAIGTLRRVLGDSATHSRYIETVGRRGYRLIVPISRSPEPAADADPGQEKPPPARPEPEVAAALYSGRKISHYRVLELIGGGGMGLVYRAEDLKLGRRVALKFLPEELAADPGVLKRFEQEARTASALNHPNICTIYSIDEFEGRPFIVMELLEGQTLRDRLAARAGEPLSLEEIVRIGSQVCSGLQAAHSKGIIHRDIKPANIFLIRDGLPKILDFGLAKLIDDEGLHAEGEAFSPDPVRTRPPPNLNASLTVTGMAIGTAGYMSPEQIRRERLDARTDLFSMGLVLYEMTTGRRAFSADSIAAVHDAIQTHEPVPARRIIAKVHPGLEHILQRALEKDRNRRYQTAEELREDLQQLLGAKKHISRRGWRGLGATALVAAVTVAGLIYWRTTTAEKISAKDAVVVADVTNQSADSVLGDAVNTALGTEFAQTPFLNILAPDKVRETLVELHHDPAGKVTPAVAREVCLRTNSKAMITSLVKDAGNAYALQLNMADCRTGRIFATASATASRDRLIHTLGVMAERLRIRAGEPRSSVARYGKPLEIATSASPEALHDLAEAYRLHMQFDSHAIAFYRLAIDADRTFALAYSGLAAFYNFFHSQIGLARITAAKAHDLRARFTTPDRYLADTMYFDIALGEYDKSVPIYQQWVQEFPNDVRARVNFNACLIHLGRFDEAIVQAREAIRLWPAEFTYATLIPSLANAGRRVEAEAAFHQAESRHMDGIFSHEVMLDLAEIQNDKAAIDQQIAWAGRNPSALAGLFEHESLWEENRGRLRSAWVLKGESIKEAGSPDGQLIRESDIAMEESEIGEPQAAQKLLRPVLADPRSISAPGLNIQVAYALARIGDIQSAQRYLAAAEADLPAPSLDSIYLSGMIRAAIQLEQNDPAGAVQTLEPIRPFDGSVTGGVLTGLVSAYLRGLAYLKLGDGHSAALEFQKLVSRPYLVVANGIPSLNSISLLQLARARVLEGDKDDAKTSYQQFLAQWKDADSDIPLYRQAKAEYAELR